MAGGGCGACTTAPNRERGRGAHKVIFSRAARQGDRVVTCLEARRPRSVEGPALTFNRSVHPEYTDARSNYNADELEFARGLDAIEEGWWARIFTTAAQNGYGLELPIKVGTSNTFYPDFLWWIDGKAWALERRAYTSSTRRSAANCSHCRTRCLPS